MVLREEEQRTWKLRILDDALRRIGRFQELRAERIVPSPLDLGYRNKVELAFGRGPAGPVLGFHGPATRQVIDVERCLVQGGAGHRALEEARSFFVSGPGREDPALRDPGLRLVIRQSSLEDRILVALRGPEGPFETANLFATRLARAVPGLSGVVRLLGSVRRRGGARTVLLTGRSWLEDRLGGIVFRLPAATFLQVNAAAAEAVIECVRRLALAGSGARVVDLYAGVGVYGIGLAAGGAEVVACDADGEAVACARQAAHDASVSGYRVVRSDVAMFLGTRSARFPRPDVVIANPPRTGLGRGVAAGIADLHPARIVVVSCDPPTLARDLRALADRGYAPRRVVAYDLFPQTPHVESVTLLEPL
jgi:23S rRNA (uracil-5-)-methyltransferase RumA